MSDTPQRLDFYDSLDVIEFVRGWLDSQAKDVLFAGVQTALWTDLTTAFPQITVGRTDLFLTVEDEAGKQVDEKWWGVAQEDYAQFRQQRLVNPNGGNWEITTDPEKIYAQDDKIIKGHILKTVNRLVRIHGHMRATPISPRLVYLVPHTTLVLIRVVIQWTRVALSEGERHGSGGEAAIHSAMTAKYNKAISDALLPISAEVHALVANVAPVAPTAVPRPARVRKTS
jgi:hypothetical protein